MKFLSSASCFTAVIVTTACAPTPQPGTEALTLQTDLQKQPPASAVCTRGNNPAAVTISPDGKATGRIVGGSGTFAGKIEVTGPQSIVFTVNEGAIDKEILTEKMVIVDKGGTAGLRGKTFDCKEVMVRSPG